MREDYLARQVTEPRVYVTENINAYTPVHLEGELLVRGWKRVKRDGNGSGKGGGGEGKR
jgi:hypothetical protein